MPNCTLYKGHWVAIVQSHHVIPKSWFPKGQLIDTPMAELCPNCHVNVHWAIDQMVRGGHPMHSREVGPRCIKLAQQALKLALEKGLTPGRTL